MRKIIIRLRESKICVLNILNLIIKNVNVLKIELFFTNKINFITSIVEAKIKHDTKI